MAEGMARIPGLLRHAHGDQRNQAAPASERLFTPSAVTATEPVSRPSSIFMMESAQVQRHARHRAQRAVGLSNLLIFRCVRVLDKAPDQPLRHGHSSICRYSPSRFCLSA